MKRIVLFLIIAAIVMFAVVLKTPFRTLRSAIFQEDDSIPVAQVPQKRAPSSKGTRAKAARAKAGSARSSHQPEAVERKSISTVDTAAVDEAKALSKRIPQNLVASSTLMISADSVAVYSINSTQGSILCLLKRGTVVVPTLQVMDGDVSWVLVKVPELKVSGFIQAEQLVASSGE